MLGGVIGRRKTKADVHSVVVADATKVAKDADERADRAMSRLDDAFKRINALEDRENRRDELARQHLRWDWRQVRALTDLGIEVEDPPALFLYDEPMKGN
jgi:uncharacterized lipoprotein YehR (DUF1307 family)